MASEDGLSITSSKKTKALPLPLLLALTPRSTSGTWMLDELHDI